MLTARAIELAGGTRQLAALLGIKPQAIRQWGERMPTGRQWQLQLLRPEWFVAA